MSITSNVIPRICNWIQISGLILQQFKMVVEVEFEIDGIPRRFMIPKAAIAENSFIFGQVQTIRIQKWFLLRNRIIPFE